MDFLVEKTPQIFWGVIYTKKNAPWVSKLCFNSLYRSESLQALLYLERPNKKALLEAVYLSMLNLRFWQSTVQTLHH